MFGAIASFPFFHKLGKIMGEKKRSLWIHVSLLFQQQYILPFWKKKVAIVIFFSIFLQHCRFSCLYAFPLEH